MTTWTRTGTNDTVQTVTTQHMIAPGQLAAPMATQHMIVPGQTDDAVAPVFTAEEIVDEHVAQQPGAQHRQETE